MDLKNSFSVLVEKLRAEHPVVHHITNYVTVESCADICYAAGSRPVMADWEEEVEDITAHADALVLNLGMLNKSKMEAMERSAICAKVNKLPVVLDPVGVMASPLRLNFAVKMLNMGLITIVRGNLAECTALLMGQGEGRGVDSDVESTADGTGLRIAQEAAKKYNCVFAVTGQVDNISDGKRALMLNNGHPMLKEITGSGCMTSSLVASCAAISEDKLVAAALGVVIMGQSAELAANFLEKKDGPGMFKVRLMDAVYHVTSKWNLVNLAPEQKVK
ncbi:MAG: hydroxyethylthiazole kinase [Phascolarctobacterium sp.]|nr:hydroxyethylthiazole kinase [Phascolarctobacterium sp.]